MINRAFEIMYYRVLIAIVFSNKNNENKKNIIILEEKLWYFKVRYELKKAVLIFNF